MDIHRCRFVDYTPQTITTTAFSHNSDPANFTPKSLRLAIGRTDGSIEIWNPRNTSTKWLLESTIGGSAGGTVEGLVWSSPENETPRLFSIGGSTYLTEWDTEKGIPIKNHDSNAGVIWSVATSGDQEKIALGCDDGSVVVVDLSGGLGSIEHEQSGHMMVLLKVDYYRL
ncbi:unnamed protein product [Ambrosiozyma monospora]|uniref:Unnamed protein product n=1 Tax=Ambrosiozyma monospora TaxID=43982 RepID=A0ACB5TLW3_AMBMO|nr:unnamed protein product [Ambrosiozyma monospora]